MASQSRKVASIVSITSGHTQRVKKNTSKRAAVKKWTTAQSNTEDLETGSRGSKKTTIRTGGSGRKKKEGMSSTASCVGSNTCHFSGDDNRRSQPQTLLESQNLQDIGGDLHVKLLDHISKSFPLVDNRPSGAPVVERECSFKNDSEWKGVIGSLLNNHNLVSAWFREFELTADPQGLGFELAMEFWAAYTIVLRDTYNYVMSVTEKCTNVKSLDYVTVADETISALDLFCETRNKKLTELLTLVAGETSAS